MKQKGFTLVELLVAMAVGSIILVSGVLSIQQIIVATGRSNSQVVALTDINRAVLAIKKDLLMAQTTNLQEYPQTVDLVAGDNLTLNWTDYTLFTSTDPTPHSSVYTLSSTELRRNYDGVVSVVGRRITSISFTQSGRVISVVITATGSGVSQRSETLEFSAYIRAEEIE